MWLSILIPSPGLHTKPRYKVSATEYKYTSGRHKQGDPWFDTVYCLLTHHVFGDWLSQSPRLIIVLEARLSILQRKLMIVTYIMRNHPGYQSVNRKHRLHLPLSEQNTLSLYKSN